MVDTYCVQDKIVQVNPNLEYLAPHSLTLGTLYTLHAGTYTFRFNPLNIGYLLNVLSQPRFREQLDTVTRLFLEHCRASLESVHSTQDVAQTQIIEEERPVRPPDKSGNIKVLEGLENTIWVLEQLQR